MEKVILQIRGHRDAKGMTQRDLANMVGVSHVTVCNWEAGKIYPSADRIPAIAAVLSCTTDELFGFQRKPTTSVSMKGDNVHV